jgi:hypothetical protein
VLVTTAISLFVGLTIGLAASIVLALANQRFVARHPSSRHPRSRASAIFLAPLHAWRLGARALPLALAGSLLFYLVLWVSAAIGGVA